MSFLLILMGTALIYLQSGQKRICEIKFVNSSVFVFSEEGKNVILRAVALVSKDTYFKPMLTFWPF